MRLGIRAQVAVVVGASGREQAQRHCHLAHRGGRGGVEAPIVHLEPGEPDLDQLAKQVQPRGRLAEMGQDRDAAGGE